MRYLMLLVAMAPWAAGCGRMVDAGPSSGSEAVVAQSEPGGANSPIDADNTGVNVRDREGDAPTPLDQGQGQDDINTTATIRKRIVEQPVSINAQNVKIITRAGKVTLRGPVKTPDEKQLIETIASEVAGAENVKSMLDVERE